MSGLNVDRKPKRGKSEDIGGHGASKRTPRTIYINHCIGGSGTGRRGVAVSRQGFIIFRLPTGRSIFGHQVTIVRCLITIVTFIMRTCHLRYKYYVGIHLTQVGCHYVVEYIGIIVVFTILAFEA